uniref:RNA-directed DNA polymerase n=1 Tax=Trichuris muris TaxID=70415 RepID=A0A5S6QMV4_TRIMR
MRDGGRPLLGRAWFRPFNIAIHVPSHKLTVTPSETKELRGSGWRQVTGKYPKVSQPGLGQYKGPPIYIELVPGAKTRFFKCRPVPFALVDRVKDEIVRLDKRGSLKQVLWSDWASPIVTVMKKGGKVHICGDYSATVNLFTRKDVYPLPTVPEMLTVLTGGAWFSKLDLAEACQQLTLDEESAEVLTPVGLRRMKRLPFEVDVAPGVFQRLMETLLQGIPGVKPYLDDILITGRSEKEHDWRLEQVLKILANNGLRLNKEKCSFGTEEMEFLGFRVTKEGIQPTEEKLRAIKDAPPLKDVKQLQAFLGLLNFYSVFLPRKVTVLEPLHRLLDSTTRSSWHWDTKEHAAFEAAKGLLTAKAVLVVHFDGTKPLLLACDASDYGLGAVLSQVENGQEKVVAYASRTLTKTERNYSQIDKEALALMFGVKKFHQYLFGRHFTAVTDHKSLLGLLATKKPTPTVMTTRMLRWRLLLSAYDINLVNRSGKLMGNADGLSRLPLPNQESTGTPGEEFVNPSLFADVMMMGVEGNEGIDDVTLLDARTVAKLTRKDPILSRLQHWVLHGWPSGNQGDHFTQFIRRRDELTAVRGCLLLWGSRVVVPKHLQKDILEVLHHAHPGAVRMKALARSYVWWPGIDEEIEHRVADCSNCQQHRNNPAKAPPRIWNWTPRPWSRIHIDFAGLFHGRTYLLAVDSHSKWLEVEQVASMESKEVIRYLARLFAIHG